MENVKYCKNCLSEMDASLESDFCCQACQLAYEASDHDFKVRCKRCGKSDGITQFLIGENCSTYLCEDCFEKYMSELESSTEKFTGNKYFEKAAKYIIMGLNDMGFETDYDNFHDTPKRFARAYSEIFSGCVNTQQQVKQILSTSFPSQGSENMVIAKDIVCFSACPHHLLPVEYHVCVGYIPSKDGSVLGISKLSRLVEVLAKRPALQETFTQEIVNALDSIGCEGSIALVEGQHMCMRMRGAKATNASITTTSVSGYFKDNDSTKQEFLNNVSDRLKFRG